MTLSLCNHLAADSAYQALRRDVLDGLAGSPKSLPPKWFYDSVGSDLFDQITRLPEYYPTRVPRRRSCTLGLPRSRRSPERTPWSSWAAVRRRRPGFC